jgi:tRNA A-37 threonylcarbamoyl transferase component Bud32
MLNKIFSLLQLFPKVFITADQNIPSQGYVCNTYDTEVPTNLNGKPTFETGSSIIISLDNGDILKCLKIRHWTEYHKLILGKNRAIEEVASNFLMKNIGLNVPTIKYHGIFSNLFSKRKFTSFYTMEKIPSDYQPGNLVFSRLRKDAKNHLINKLSLDINTLKEHTLIYSDLSLKNILANSSGEYYWIDTQVKTYRNKSKFKSKFNKTLYRFIDEPFLSITTAEKDQLKKLLSIN